MRTYACTRYEENFYLASSLQNKLLLREFSHKSFSRNINSYKGNNIPVLQTKIDNVFVYDTNFFASFDQF